MFATYEDQFRKATAVVYNPPVEVRHPASQRFHQILNELAELHDRKQQDYGSDVDPFANIRSGEAFGTPAWVGCMIRANDKVIRIQSFARKGVLANESLEDSLRDLAVYAIIGLVLLEQDQDAAAREDDEGFEDWLRSQQALRKSASVIDTLSTEIQDVPLSDFDEDASKYVDEHIRPTWPGAIAVRPDQVLPGPFTLEDQPTPRTPEPSVVIEKIARCTCGHVQNVHSPVRVEGDAMVRMCIIGNCGCQGWEPVGTGLGEDVGE